MHRSSLIEMFFVTAFGLASLLSFSPKILFAQQTSLPTAWQLKQGSRVVSLLEDKQNCLWAGTEEDGLWRWNSVHRIWQQATSKQGLGDDCVYSLACDKVGRVWAGTLNHGVSVFNGQSWKTYDFLTGPYGVHVVALCADQQSGDVWIGNEWGLSRYIAATDTWKTYTKLDGLPSNQIDSLALDKEDNLYVGTQCDGIATGSASNNYTKWQCTPGPLSPPAAASGKGLPSDLINCLLTTKSGRVYAGTDSGLAWSDDSGATWTYERGADWLDKIRNSYSPPLSVPPAALTPLLSEDYVTSLAAGANGSIIVGHRAKGYEVLETSDLVGGSAGKVKSQPIGGTEQSGDYVAALLPLESEPGGLAVGWYGAGLTIDSTGYSSSMPIPAGGTFPASSAQEFPSPAAPPSISELASDLSTFDCIKDSTTNSMPNYPAAEFAGDDWSTQGDWIGSYGDRDTTLCAQEAPLDEYVQADRSYDISGQVGPHIGTLGPRLTEPDSMRHWVEWLESNDQRVLYNPAIGHRRESEWDDHGEAYNRSHEGPDLWVTVSVPAGIHRASLYFFNKDGQAGQNRSRDYLIEVKGWVPDIRKAERVPTLAWARVNQFRGGVYKQFYLAGPGKYNIRINRNYSFNTILCAVFLDKVSGPPTQDEGKKAVYTSTMFESDPFAIGRRDQEPPKQITDAASSLSAMQTTQAAAPSISGPSNWRPVPPPKPIPPPTYDNDFWNGQLSTQLMYARVDWNNINRGSVTASQLDVLPIYRLMVYRLAADSPLQNPPTVYKKLHPDDPKIEALQDQANIESTGLDAPTWPDALEDIRQTQLAHWRWTMHEWAPEDHEKYWFAMYQAWEAFVAINPNLQAIYGPNGMGKH